MPGASTSQSMPDIDRSAGDLVTQLLRNRGSDFHERNDALVQQELLGWVDVARSHQQRPVGVDAMAQA